MKTTAKFFFLTMLAALVAQRGWGAADDIRRDATVQVVERVLPSVVNIMCRTQRERRGYFYDWWRDNLMPYSQKLPPQLSAGSGVIVDEAGYVLTNVHVVEEADEILCKLSDGEIVPAEIIRGTRKSDIALLKLVSKTPRKFAAAKFAAPDDLLLGETVIALGNPFGLGGSVSRGILSSKNRRATAAEGESLEVPDWLQTDAAINPGNSGGPLINLRGEVIGINVAVYRQGQGIGFAIPIKQVSETLADIFTPEIVSSLWFGARLAGGVLPLKVAEVQSGSPAEKAGLRAGDAIVEIDRKTPKSLIDFNAELLAAEDERPVSLVVERAGGKKNLSLQLIPLANFFNADLIKQKLGATVQPLTPESAERFRVRITSGLIVTAVEKNSPAEAADLQKRYIISAIDGEPTVDALTAARILYSKKKGDRVALTVTVERSNGNFLNRETGRAVVTVR
ncbi:MAG: trypsin-like peptidase domain-containing protein [Verrucomicrobia bacterium]|nr:trypsin-like peptidase domain-containing protein [Verrucomicrobiota bacterium]